MKAALDEKIRLQGYHDMDVRIATMKQGAVTFVDIFGRILQTDLDSVVFSLVMGMADRINEEVLKYKFKDERKVSELGNTEP